MTLVPPDLRIGQAFYVAGVITVLALIVVGIRAEKSAGTLARR